MSEFLIILQERELWDMTSLGACTCRLVLYAASYTPRDGLAATFGSTFPLHSQPLTSQILVQAILCNKLDFAVVGAFIAVSVPPVSYQFII